MRILPNLNDHRSFHGESTGIVSATCGGPLPGRTAVTRISFRHANRPRDASVRESAPADLSRFVTDVSNPPQNP